MKRNIKFFLACFAAIVASILLSSHSDSVFAYSLTVTTSGTVTANVLPSSGGTGTAVVSDDVGIVSNCRAGYNFAISGPSDNNLYLNGDSTNNTSGTYLTPVNGTSALNNSANTNKWGYSLTANSKTGVFSALSSTATTLKTPSETASPDSDINTTIPVYYGTSVSEDMAVGNYTFANSGVVTYSVVMDTSCTTYSIQYDGNTPDNPNGMGTTDQSTGVKSVKQINISEDTKVTLLASNFKKAGYGFLGWSTDQDAYTHFTDNDNTNDPIIYGPMEDVIVDSTMMSTANSRNIITMYAVWVPALKDGSNNTVYFQDWDNPNTNLPHDGCSTLTQTTFDDTITGEKGKIIVAKDSFTALTDKRDNMVYAVARLADGNCWMIENLRLDNQYTMGQNQNDSSVTNQSLSQGYGGTTGVYGNFVGLADPESANFSNSATSNSVYKSSDATPIDTYDPINNTLEDIGTTSYPGLRLPRYNSNNTQSPIDSTTYTQNYTNISPSSSGTFPAANIYSYGNYYTIAAALANTNHRFLTAFRPEYYGTSICPSSWYLPSSSIQDREYSTLSQSYGGTGDLQSGIAEAGDIMSNRFRSFPNNFIQSGSFSSSSAGNRGYNGGYWDKNGWYLFLKSSELSPSSSDGSSPNFGRSIRCLAGPSNVEITLDSNNGTGSVSRLYGIAGNTVTLPYSSNPSASTAISGYGFKNWNTAPNGSGTTYTSSYAIPAGSTGITLYAQWNAQYTITYTNNCMSWASGDSNCTATSTTNTSTLIINLDASGDGSGLLGNYNKFTMTGWKIKEWTTNADGTGIAYPINSWYTVTSANPGDGITLYAHWVPIYSIQYDGNGSDNDATGMGSTDSSTGLKSVRHTNVGEGDTFDLFASNFKKAGYGFVGWSTDANAWAKLTDNDNTNDAKIWGPNEVITAPAYDGTPITTLYAVWAPAETSGGNPVYLQGWTGCSAMTATTYDSTTGTLTVAKDSITALTDERDGEVYAIAKLADENCWMIENLRLADTHEENGNTVATTLTTSNTNIDTSNNTLPITNIYNADSSLATKSNSLSPSSSQSSTNDASYGWCINRNAACYNQSRLNTTNITWNNNTASAVTPSLTQSITSANAHISLDNYVYSYGNYYNWYSATLGYGTYGKSSGNVDGDLCPAGWKLPYGNNGSSGTNIGNTKGGFYYLANQMSATNSNQANSNKFRMFPNNFLYSGDWDRSSAGVRGNSGFYWSASAYNNYTTYYLYFASTSIIPGNDGTNKYYGGSVRCLIGS